MLLFLSAGLVGVAVFKGRKMRKSWVLGFSGLAIILYPFARFSLDLPLVSEWKPSEERSSDILEGLLTNMYRSFDVRDEDQVYDRLAKSVTGEQLSEIYLQNRRALELENRGGTRAHVDDVQVLEVDQVTRKKNGFEVEALWTVSGSVSHFGHTHYRRNQYHAGVLLVQDKGTWKVKEIEVLDEVRLL